MARAVQLPPAGFDQLSVEEKIDYVQELWSRISADETNVPVPDWHRAVLEERLAEFRADPDAGRTWEDVEAQLTGRLRR